MHKFIYKVLIVLAILQLSLLSATARHKVYMLHPTVGNIENVLELVRLRLIEVQDLEIVGVYHEMEASDYSRSEKYLTDKKIENFKLEKIIGDLNIRNIYGENGCTGAFRQIVREADAILFNGGPDIQPSIYGEKQNLLTEVTDPYRHLMETSLFFHLTGGSRNPEFKPLLLEKPGLIVRAFCLGMQTMNVAAGGTLIQDIPEEVYHITTAEGMLEMEAKNRHRNYNTQLNPGIDLSWSFLHPVKLKTGSFLDGLCLKTGQPQPYILSSHHQAVGKLGSNLDVIATSVDGKIVEALQHKIFREVIGVQFHPEQSSLYVDENRYTYTPGNSFSLRERLGSERSLEFHLNFWKDFSQKVLAASSITK